MLDPLAGGSVALAAAVPSVAVDAFFGRRFGSGAGPVWVSFVLARADLALGATGVTMPVLNMISCVPMRMADETTM